MKIGRSGVELKEVRKNVDINGNERSKPISNYHENMTKHRSKGSPLSCNRLISHGFGPSKLNININIPKLNSKQKHLLLAIDSGRMIDVPNENPIIRTLIGLGLISWSERDRQWKTMAEGRRVAGILSSTK